MLAVCHLLGEAYPCRTAGTAREDSNSNKTRAPSGPVKTMVSPTAHTRQTPGVIITNRVSALIAWFPARWASQIASRLIRCNNAQDVSHVYIQNVRSGALSRPTGAEGEKGPVDQMAFFLPSDLLTIMLPALHGILIMTSSSATASVL